ncbi:MAG: hypothetical protein AMJ62_12605 [Myxococcales bacterium SG8_38]|nr:MAG: hypothetical protein AMJ62_12605 [Myxococcales bacterium SG8_38]
MLQRRGSPPGGTVFGERRLIHPASAGLLDQEARDAKRESPVVAPGVVQLSEHFSVLGPIAHFCDQAECELGKLSIRAQLLAPLQERKPGAPEVLVGFHDAHGARA